MFNIGKFLIWSVCFLLWLFGKLDRYDFSIKFRDLFPFLYFIYIFIYTIILENKIVFNFLGYILCFLFIISIYTNFISGVRYSIRQVKAKIKLVEKIDNAYHAVKKYLFEQNFEEVAEIILASILIGLIYIQINFNTPTIDIVNKSNIEILGFVIAILSMYGIYIGFLQYLASDSKADMYLGKSKVNYLIEKSIWYYITQSRLFFFMLLATMIVPIAVKLNIPYIREFTILWQTSYVLSLIIYIFLLSMSLYVIRVALLMKSKADDNLKYNISKQIQKNYTEDFWFFYSNRHEYSNNFIKNKLSRDFSKLDTSEYEEFIYNIFRTDIDIRNLNYSISEKISSGFQLTRTKKFLNKLCTKLEISNKNQWLKSYKEKNNSDLGNEWKDFYRYFKTFIYGKWRFLKLYKDYFSPDIWQNLIHEDLKIIDKLVKSDPTLTILKIESPHETRFSVSHRNENIREFLFKLLVDKQDINLNQILHNINDEERNLRLSDDKQFFDYDYEFLRFQLLILLDIYKNGGIDINILEFRRASDFYSQICFDYLGTGRIETFVQNKITKAESEEEIKQKRRAEKIQNLILSMNEEYRLAFMLYQLIYTDYTQWDDNIEFYDTEIKKLMSCDEEQQNYLFEQAKEKILSTNISHRITDKLLDSLWTKRNEKITDFYWFKQFGRRHQMSELKIIYVQSLLSGKRFSFSSRFNFIYDSLSFGNVVKSTKNSEKCIKVSTNKLHWRRVRNKEKMDNFCREYLLLTDKFDSIFTNDFYSYKQNDIQLSVEYLLNTNKVDLSNVITNLSVSSLLRLEQILIFRGQRNNRYFNYTSRTIFDSMTSNSPFYWSGGEGVLEFYVLKTIDSFYHDLYRDTQFLDGLKHSLISTLNFHNFTINEYVEVIAKKVSSVDSISIFQKEEIICKLNDLLYNTETKSSQSKLAHKKIYRYR